MLELRPGDEGKGTEGRDAVTVWFLPFGRTKNNQFGEIIKMHLYQCANSYDDLVLSTFEKLLMECAQIATGAPDPDLPIRGGESRAFGVVKTSDINCLPPK
jgi:hypothetical protein